MPPNGKRLAIRLATGLIALSGITDAHAQTIITAIVIDRASAVPISAADIRVKRADASLASVRSNEDGRAVISFNAGAGTQALQLVVQASGYAELASNFAVTAGAASPNNFRMELIPKSIEACIRRGRQHAIVVGHFLPPIGAQDSGDFSARIAQNIQFDVVATLQRNETFAGRVTAQPSARDCPGAKPADSLEYVSYAKALGADAFLVGSVAATGGTHQIDMTIVDPNRSPGIVPPPVRTQARLDSPQAARLSPPARLQLVEALVAGYERANAYAECVAVTVAAESLFSPTLPQSLVDARTRCQSKLPNTGLLAGGGP